MYVCESLSSETLRPDPNCVLAGQCKLLRLFVCLCCDYSPASEEDWSEAIWTLVARRRTTTFS